MTTHLEIHFDPSEGALLRCLGLIQRRGYRVTEMAMRAHPDGPLLTAAIEADGRSAETLVRQIERLHDVRSVSNHRDVAPSQTLADFMRAFSRFLPSSTRRPQPAVEMGR
jgi:acetolactate synthase regulatory subunit